MLFENIIFLFLKKKTVLIIKHIFFIFFRIMDDIFVKKNNYQAYAGILLVYLKIYVDFN